MHDVALRLHPSAANLAVHETYAWCMLNVYGVLFLGYTCISGGNIAHYVHYKD